MNIDDINFEISFYENLIEKNPDFTEALFALGDAYTKKGLYKKGLEIDKRLVALKPDDSTAHYNLACDYSLLKESDLSLGALKKAIELGHRDFKFMEEDSDLEYIRQDKRYKELIAKHKEKLSSRQKESPAA